MPPRAPRTNNKKKKGKKKKSVSAYMEQLTNIPSTHEEYIKASADGIRKNAQETIRMMQHGYANSDNQGEMEQKMKEMTKPMELTPQVIQEIKNLEASESILWYVETNLDTQVDVSVLSCCIHLLDDRAREDLKDKPNDYSLDSKKNRISMRLGYCLKIYEHKDDSLLKCIEHKSLDEKNLIIGTIAKTIYGNGMPRLGSLSFLKPKDGDKNKMIKPKMLFFSSKGMMNRLLPDLEAMGIKKKNVCLAHTEIVQEAAVLNRLVGENNAMSNVMEKLMTVDPNDERKFSKTMGKEMMKSANRYNIPYVSEVRKPLGNYTESEWTLPKHWICQPPPRRGEYRLTDLLGWRRNLELAVIHMDVDKVHELTEKHSMEDVRELCEIRNLLTKMAQGGLARACTLLLESCHVFPDGPRDRNFPRQWMEYTKHSGYDVDGGDTPLMLAARSGQYDACKVLLEFKDEGSGSNSNSSSNRASTSVNVNMKCFRAQSTALHYAMAEGHSDVVKLLCQNGADVSAENSYGQDSIDLLDMFSQPEAMAQSGVTLKEYRKIGEVLREFDDRCSYCRRRCDVEIKVMRVCPCHKERYCGVECQKKRWPLHNTLHKKVMKKKEAEANAEAKSEP